MSEHIKSAAREHIEQKAKLLLEQYGLLAEDFNQDMQQGVEQGQGTPQMLKDDKSSIENTPPPDMRRDADRENFNDRWKEEQENHNDYENER